MCAFCLQALTWDSGCSCLGLDRRTSEHVHASDASLDQLWLCILRDDVRGFLFLQMFPIDFRQPLRKLSSHVRGFEMSLDATQLYATCPSFYA